MTRARETSENARQAKAWVNFDGTFGSSPFTLANGGIRRAFNVSSITDNGVGSYTMNFAAAMPDANYSTLCTGPVASTLTRNFSAGFGTTDYTAGSVKLFRESSDGNAADASIFCVAVFH